MNDARTIIENLEHVEVRLADDQDQHAIRRLYEASILEGQTHGNDTGADIDHMREAYFNDEGASAFWVALYAEEVIGMVGVQHTHLDAAEIRRLRVDDRFRRQGVGARLMEQALTFCADHGYLKVVLDVRIERAPAIALFEKFGFIHARTRDIDGRKLVDFYVDLYRGQGT